jgi:hypothetical protein
MMSPQALWLRAFLFAHRSSLISARPLTCIGAFPSGKSVRHEGIGHREFMARWK